MTLQKKLDIIKARRAMRFEVRVYSEDGRSKGSTILDSSIDVLDDGAINSIALARDYAKRFLASRSDYFLVDRI